MIQTKTLLECFGRHFFERIWLLPEKFGQNCSNDLVQQQWSTKARNLLSGTYSFQLFCFFVHSSFQQLTCFTHSRGLENPELEGVTVATCGVSKHEIPDVSGAGWESLGRNVWLNNANRGLLANCFPGFQSQNPTVKQKKKQRRPHTVPYRELCPARWSWHPRTGTNGIAFEAKAPESCSAAVPGTLPPTVGRSNFLPKKRWRFLGVRNIQKLMGIWEKIGCKQFLCSAIFGGGAKITQLRAHRKIQTSSPTQIWQLTQPLGTFLNF